MMTINTKTDCLFIALQKEIKGLLDKTSNYLTDKLTTEEQENLIKAVEKVHTKVPELVQKPWFSRTFETQWNSAKDNAEKLKLLTGVFQNQEKAVPLLRQLAVYEITQVVDFSTDPINVDDGLLKDYLVSLKTTYEIFKDIYNTKLAESSKEVNDKTKKVETLRKELGKATKEQQLKETDLETAKQAVKYTEELFLSQDKKTKRKKTEFANLLLSVEKAKKESVSGAAQETEKEPSDLSKALKQFEKNKTDVAVGNIFLAFEKATVKKPNLEELKEKIESAYKELEAEQSLLETIEKQLVEGKNKKEEAQEAFNTAEKKNKTQEGVLETAQKDLQNLEKEAIANADKVTKDQALADTCEAEEIKDSEFMLYPDLKKSFIENAEKSNTFDVGVKSEWKKRGARTFFQALATNTQGYKSHGGSPEAGAIGQLLGLNIGIIKVNSKLEGKRLTETFGKTSGQSIELVHEPDHWETLEEFENKKKLANSGTVPPVTPKTGSAPIAPSLVIPAGEAELDLKVLFDAINGDAASQFTLEKFSFASINVAISNQKGIVIKDIEAIKKASANDLKQIQSAHCVFNIDVDKRIEYRFEKDTAGVITKNEYLVNDVTSSQPDDFLPNFKAMVAIAVAGGHEKLDLSPLTKNLPAYVACLVACQEGKIKTVPDDAGQMIRDNVAKDAGLLDWYKNQLHNLKASGVFSPPLVAVPAGSKKGGLRPGGRT